MTGKADAVNFMYRFKYVIALALVAVLVTAQASNVYSVSPSNVTTYSKWTGVNDYSYIIFTDGSTYYGKNGNTGAIDYSGTDFVVLMQNVINAAEVNGTIAIRSGTYNLVTNTINLTKGLTIEGLGIVQLVKTGDYVGNQHAIFSIQASDVTLEGLSLIDNVRNTATKLIVVQPTAPIKNLVIQNIELHNSGWQGIIVSADYPVDGVLIDHVIVDTTGNSGVGILIGKSVTNAIVQNSRVIESAHTAIGIWGSGGNIKILNNYINKTTNTAGYGISVSNYRDAITEIGDVHNILIEGNTIVGPVQFDSITINAEAKKIIVQDNFIERPARDGIDFTFLTLNGTNLYAKEVLIDHNIIYNPGVYGIAVVANAAEPFPAISITNNYIKEPRSYGITVGPAHNSIIANNLIYHPGLDGAANNSGIGLGNANATQVFGNQIYGNSSLTWSIREFGAAGTYSNSIHDNTVNYPITWLGTATKVSRNIGFVTENKGIGTIASGSTSVVITHGLSYTPTAGDLTITFTNNPTNNPGNWWISSITSTQFTVNVRSDPGASTLTFNWAARRV